MTMLKALPGMTELETYAEEMYFSVASLAFSEATVPDSTKFARGVRLFSEIVPEEAVMLRLKTMVALE